MTDRFFFGLVFPLLSVIVLWYCGSGLAPAYRARFGTGAAGVFLAEHESCNRSCFWTGTFTADAGYTRPHVGLASGHGPHRVGDRVAAIDTGDSENVFPRGGGWDWLIVTALILAATGYLAACGRWLWRRVRRYC